MRLNRLVAMATAAAGMFVATLANAATMQVAAGELVFAGKLTICSDIPAPPQEMYTTSGEPEGSDVDTGNAIAKQLGLTPIWVNTVFDTIIEALTTGKCDLILTGIFITPDRSKQIDFIPYLTAGQQLLVKKGNPENLTDDFHSLCGKSIGSQIGGVELDTLKTYSTNCQTAGLKPIDILASEKVDTSLEQMLTNRSAAFFFDSPTVAYYAHLRPNDFETVEPAIGLVVEGIGVPKNHPTLNQAVKVALKNMQASGEYTQLLAKWGLQNTKIPPIE